MGFTWSETSFTFSKMSLKMNILISAVRVQRNGLLTLKLATSCGNTRTTLQILKKEWISPIYTLKKIKEISRAILFKFKKSRITENYRSTFKLREACLKILFMLFSSVKIIAKPSSLKITLRK